LDRRTLVQRIDKQVIQDILHLQNFSLQWYQSRSSNLEKFSLNRMKLYQKISLQNIYICILFLVSTLQFHYLWGASTSAVCNISCNMDAGECARLSHGYFLNINDVIMIHASQATLRQCRHYLRSRFGDSFALFIPQRNTAKRNGKGMKAHLSGALFTSGRAVHSQLVFSLLVLLVLCNYMSFT
jgi:hypothetical protein